MRGPAIASRPYTISHSTLRTGTGNWKYTEADIYLSVHLLNMGGWLSMWQSITSPDTHSTVDYGTDRQCFFGTRDISEIASMLLE